MSRPTAGPSPPAVLPARPDKVADVRALVTGGRGFVGTWLTAHLEALGDDVVAIDHEVDITDLDALSTAVRSARPDAVYHLAAFTHVGQSWKDPGLVMQVNALGTLHVLEAARAQPDPPVVLLTSSAEVYGAVSEDLLPVAETAPLAPVTPYAASKVAAEYLGVQQHLAHGLRVVRVRPFNHVGPGQAAGFVIPSLAARVVEARRQGTTTMPVGNLSARRDFTDVRDVVRAYRMLVEAGTPGEVYNVCSGRDVGIEEIARILLRLAGTELELVRDPELERPVDVPVVRGDPTKLQRATGWVPEIDLERTLRDVLEHWSSRAR
jgi:GDP-4-dehydro-6-deoxy-D-mannose reductase